MRFLYLLCIITAFFSLASKSVLAQNLSLGVATYVTVSGKSIQNGSIVSASGSGFKLSNRTYDPLVFGIVTLNPAVSFGQGVGSTTYPVISAGQAFILIDGEGGAIHSGDLLTTSSTPGVGMRASQTGYIIGSSLIDATFAKSSDKKLIPISLNIHFYTTKASLPSRLTDLFNFSLIAASDEPLAVFKYVVALVIIVLSFVLGLFSFGKIATNGIEALGRNPLAGKMIELGIIFNVIITIAIIAAGIVMALFIIRL